MARFKKGEPRPAKAGRRKGTPNKHTREVREMVKCALEDAGGVDYLKSCAKSPSDRVRSAFLSLVAKLIPSEVKGQFEQSGSVVFQVVTGFNPPASQMSEDEPQDG